MTDDDRLEHRGRIVRARVVTTAPPDHVWDAWADPRHLCGWFTDTASGRARPGATVTWGFDRFRCRFPYEVLAAVPGSRLVLQGAPVGRPPYLLEILIDAHDGATTVELINSGFSVGTSDDEETEGVHSGWRIALAIMKLYLERHYGRPRLSFFAMQPAPFEYGQISRYFHEPDGLARWLTSSGAVGAEGDAFELVLRDGSPMSGRVLAVTPRETALSWDEADGVVELKAFRLGPRIRAVSLRGSGWGMSEEKARAIESMAVASIDRLVAEMEDRQPGPAL